MIRPFAHLFALLAFAALATARAQSAADPAPPPQKRSLAIEIDGGVGCGEYQGEVKPGLWYPVWIYLKANEAGATGMLTIAQDGNPLSVQIPFDVAKGSAKRFRSYYKPFDRDRNAPKLKVRVETEKLGRDEFVLPMRFANAPEDHHILVLCDDLGSFGFLTRRIAAADQTEIGLAERRPLYASPELLPDDPIALEPFDAIIISTDKLKRIRPEAWAAIEQWVWLGGRVLLSGGKHQPFLAGSPVDGAFGLKLAEPEPAELERALGRDDLTTQTGILAAWPANPPEYWSKVYAGSRVRPLIGERRVGEGRFIYASMALDEAVMAVINSRREGSDLWWSMLERRSGPPDLVSQASLASMNYAYELQSAFGVRLAPTSWVLAYLLSYIILAVPFNWWLCARLKRREMAWGVALLLALGFSLFGYRSGAMAQGRAAQTRQIAFVSHASGSPVARASTLASVFSPRRLSADLKSDGTVFPSSFGGEQYDHFGQRQPNLYDDSPSAVQFSRSTEMKGFFLHPMSARNLQTDFTLPSQGGVELVPSSSPGMVASIKNNTPWTFRNWALRDAYRVWNDQGRALKPGESIDLPAVAPSLPLSAGQDWAQSAGRLYSSILPRTGAEIAQTSQSYARVIRNSRLTRGFGPPNGGQSSAAPAFQQTRQADARFRGVAQAELSTMLASLKTAANASSLVYEETYAWDQVRDVLGGDPLFSDQWVIQPGEPVSGPAEFQQTRNGETNLAFKDWWLRVTPLVGFEPPRGGALEVSLKFTLVADTGAMFKMAKTLGRDYVPRGCPLKVLNVRKNAWEDRGVWMGETIRLSPPEDYLDPSNSSIALSLDLNKWSLRFRPAGETALDLADPARQPILASDLFGSTGDASKAESYNGYFLGQWKLYAIRLSGLAVKKIAPQSESAEGATP